jgi:hypothetical protein
MSGQPFEHPIYLHHRNQFLRQLFLKERNHKTAAYATALRRAGWFGGISSRLFVGISLAAAVLVLLYPVGGKIGAPGFVLGIPAVPYVMPYLMGILLVTRASRLAGEKRTPLRNKPDEHPRSRGQQSWRHTPWSHLPYWTHVSQAPGGGRNPQMFVL